MVSERSALVEWAGQQLAALVVLVAAVEVMALVEWVLVPISLFEDMESMVVAVAVEMVT
jgi:hypothetical protein